MLRRAAPAAPPIFGNMKKEFLIVLSVAVSYTHLDVYKRQVYQVSYQKGGQTVTEELTSDASGNLGTLEGLPLGTVTVKGSTGIFSLSVAAMNSCRIHTGTAWCIRWSSWRQADIRVIRFIFRS